MLIGYSFWGFLGPGILDTPDGGRSHRRILIDGLCQRGHQPVFLQANRDHREAGLDLSDTYRWDSGFPDIDVLFLEWRWPIPGRNTTTCASPGHTCDLHRQHRLLAHYTRRGVRTIIWDKDRRLPINDPLRAQHNVVICEAALHPTRGAVSLLFPVEDTVLDNADAAKLCARPRDLALAYVGNQYDRDDAFDIYFAPAAAVHPHLVAGKWTDTAAWPHVRFIGRVPFTQVATIYGRALTTILLLPDRYGAVGQMTQRIIEAVTAGCLPLTPASIRSANTFTPTSLHIDDGAAAAQRISELHATAGGPRHTELLEECLDQLSVFRLSRQLDLLDTVLTSRHAPVGGAMTGPPAPAATGGT